MRIEFSRQSFEKCPNIEFRESPFTGSRDVFHAEGRTDGQTDRQTDMTKPVVAFRNSANALKITLGPPSFTKLFF